MQTVESRLRSEMDAIFSFLGTSRSSVQHVVHSAPTPPADVRSVLGSSCQRENEKIQRKEFVEKMDKSAFRDKNGNVASFVRRDEEALESDESAKTTSPPRPQTLNMPVDQTLNVSVNRTRTDMANRTHYFDRGLRTNKDRVLRTHSLDHETQTKSLEQDVRTKSLDQEMRTNASAHAMQTQETNVAESQTLNLSDSEFLKAVSEITSCQQQQQQPTDTTDPRQKLLKSQQHIERHINKLLKELEDKNTSPAKPP